MSSTHLRFFFFFNDTATTEIYTPSLHDALPISHPLHRDVLSLPCRDRLGRRLPARDQLRAGRDHREYLQRPLVFGGVQDRKSTRLNSSHSQISYAVFCLEKKNRFCTRLYTLVLQ